MALSNKDMLEIAIACHEKWAELVVRDIRKAIDEFDQLDAFEAHYVTALWIKRCNALSKISQYIPETDDIEEQYKLILQQWPSWAKGRQQLTKDANERLDWFKRRIAKDFEERILSKMQNWDIRSPVEQFFLMEWEYLGLSKKYEINLIPQATVETRAGKFSVDFGIRKIGKRRGSARIAIEIDGHDFHEKTREQVRSDKQRERAIVSSGVTVFRFSGSEIVRDSRRCVEEVGKYLESIEEDKQ